MTGEPGAAVSGGLTVASADGMRVFGRRLAALLRAGDLVILSGPLGAGKTTLVQGIAEGMRVRGPVTSPTFVIARVHPALASGPDLVHADAYRLASPAEVDDLDLDASLDRSVTVVEWGGGLAEGLAGDRLEIMITPAPGGGPGAAAGGAGDAGARPRRVGRPADRESRDAPPADQDPRDAPPADREARADGADDWPRMVRVSGFGSRWESAPESAFLACLAGQGAV